jgi:hypothetical protein
MKPKHPTQPKSDKTPAEFTLLIQYTHNAARYKGKPQQTHRDDFTRMNFRNNGVKIDDMHPIAILYRKFLEEKMNTFRARIFDNRIGCKDQLVFDLIIEKGVEHLNRDYRDQYYDITNGTKWQSPLEQKETKSA